MLKRLCKKKLIISSIILLLIMFLYKVPNNYTKSNTNDSNDKITQKISYVNYEAKTNEVYLLDENNYLNRVKIATKYEGEELANELIEILICDSNNQDRIPNNFKCVINKDTKINSISIKNDTIKIDFSKELLDTENEERTIESIVYTLTGIENITTVIIYIDGEILNELPKSKITIPSSLNRNFGINKKYELTDTKNISKTTIYYINKKDDVTYYTPITIVNNDPREKIEIIIDELSNKIISNSLSSYLNNNTKVLDSYIDNDTMHVNFNENILSNFDDNNILEEVIYTISLSINDNYDIKNVFFDVNNKEIAKTTIKSLE